MKASFSFSVFGYIPQTIHYEISFLVCGGYVSIRLISHVIAMSPKKLAGCQQVAKLALQENVTRGSASRRELSMNREPLTCMRVSLASRHLAKGERGTWAKISTSPSRRLLSTCFAARATNLPANCMQNSAPFVGPLHPHIRAACLASLADSANSQ